MRTIGFLTSLGLFAAALTGCGKSSAGSAVPIERNRLVIRLFHSLNGKQYAAASDQSVKLLALDPGNLYLSTMSDRQKANAVIEQAQKLVDDGKDDAAAELLDAALRLTPLNRPLLLAQERVRQLARFEALIGEFNEQPELSKQTLLLARIESTGATFKDPVLTAAINRMSKRHLARVAADEKKQKELAANSTSAARAALDAANAARRKPDGSAAAPIPAGLLPKIPGVPDAPQLKLPK